MFTQFTTLLAEAGPHFEGYVYPNESGSHPLWGVLIVLYPYITGLVAGAFIMASLVRVFRVKALEPVYRLSLLTALAFMLCATLPLLFHLGHPFRSYQIMITPHLTSPMAIFGFVYLWYLMAVLLLELWLDYRENFVQWGSTVKGPQGFLYRTLTVGVTDLSPQAVKLDHKMSWIISIVGIPSAFLLHGYVGFIFGSIKANPWWGNAIMPIIFILSAIVSGIALCVFVYIFLSKVRGRAVDMRCLDVMGMFLFYGLVIDATVEALDWVHRAYSAEEGFHVMEYMAQQHLFFTLSIAQLLLGTLVPLLALGVIQIARKRIPDKVRWSVYTICSILILVGVLAMRWNVVMGGQFYSKSLRGVMSYKFEFAGAEGWLMGGLLLALPFIILTVLIKLFLSERLPVAGHDPHPLEND
ncbi:MAG: polysulfide reductase NrfD [Akkermansiaceae bacterium]|nr:polysulfide reductase NrfD [Akkermansiaceae bacterium]MCF7733021.1 polysulfide reductase NrfD [Akkermansiaceae bacterium]